MQKIRTFSQHTRLMSLSDVITSCDSYESIIGKSKIILIGYFWYQKVICILYYTDFFHVFVNYACFVFIHSIGLLSQNT